MSNGKYRNNKITTVTFQWTKLRFVYRGDAIYILVPQAGANPCNL